MAGDSGSGHGVVAMEFWVWREGVSEDWKERENQRLRDGERHETESGGEKVANKSYNELNKKNIYFYNCGTVQFYM